MGSGKTSSSALKTGAIGSKWQDFSEIRICVKYDDYCRLAKGEEATIEGVEQDRFSTVRVPLSMTHDQLRRISVRDEILIGNRLVIMQDFGTLLAMQVLMSVKGE